MTRDEYFYKLLDLFVAHIEANGGIWESEAKKNILRFLAVNHLHACEFCNGRGEFGGRDDSDGVAQREGDCEFCNGTGSDIELETN